MIQSFTVTNHTGKSMVCDLANPWKEGLAVVSIEGLTPGQATINVADISSIDGGLFNSARLSSRNIVINLVFVDHSTLTIEDLRRKCYFYFPIKKNIKLKFTTGDGKTTKDFLIEGYVESNEPTIFSVSEGSSISIICTNPYFYRPIEQEEIFNAQANPEFFFEFSKDPVLEENTKLLMGDIVDYELSSITYDGDADTGAVFEITFKNDVNHEIEDQKIRISNSLTNTLNIISLDKIEKFMENVDEYDGIVEGDKIIFSTVKGEKYLTYIHDNIKYNILNAVIPSGEWVYLTNGVNIISIRKTDPDLQFSTVSKNKIYFYGV